MLEECKDVANGRHEGGEVMEAILCDICGQQIKKYSMYYYIKYGLVTMFIEGTCRFEEMCVCKDCMEQVIACRKAAMLNENNN